MRSAALFAWMPLAFGSGAVCALDLNPLGFYIGAAAGKATVRADQVQFLTSPPVSPLTGPLSLSKHDTGWKAFVGVRPISLIGAEIEYVDFGSATALKPPPDVGLSYSVHTSATAGAVFGVLYAPIPVPFLDVYGKVGVARLRTHTDGTAASGCFSGLLCPIDTGAFQRDRADSRFGYGAGLQVKLGKFAVRAEYERISAGTGDPDLLSVGALWSF